MARILVIADEPWVRNEVHASLPTPEFELTDLADPKKAAHTVASEDFDSVIVDMQISAMGAMAVTRALRDAAAVAGKPALPVVILADRHADGFLAKRAGAGAWVTKPFTSYELQQAISKAGEGVAAGVSAD